MKWIQGYFRYIFEIAKFCYFNTLILSKIINKCLYICAKIAGSDLKSDVVLF